MFKRKNVVQFNKLFVKNIQTVIEITCIVYKFIKVKFSEIV